MDLDSQRTSQQLPHSDLLDHVNNGLVIDHLNNPVECGICRRSLSRAGEVNSSPQTVSICGDCKFLLLEDLGTPSRDSHQRRLHRRRRSVYGSSESIENLFSHQFSQMIDLARHIDLEHEDPGDVDSNLSIMQPASSRTTPNGSRRWRRIISDTESDGFNSDAFYGDSDSNVSIGAYRVSHGDSDAISFSTYGGDSDASVDGHTILDTDIFGQSVERSDIDSDTDIDPMHAGAVQWNSDDHEAVEDDNEWEEVDTEEHAVGYLEAGTPIDRSGSSDPSFRHRRTESPEFQGIIRWRVREGRHLEIPSIVTNIEESFDAPYLGNPGDYLDAQGFEEFLEHLAETDSSRRGAPPAAASFVSSLPLVVISEECPKPDDLACAICKELLTIGTEVNQLPCFHLYHPSCILPWLSSRNSCPLCRYELPTDDTDYEQGKRNARGRMFITGIQQQDVRDDSSSIESDLSEMDEAQELGELLGNVGSGAADSSSRTNGGRGRWLFLAAAPIVSLMGIVFVLWLGNPLTGGRCQIGQRSLHGQHPQYFHTSDSGPRDQRVRRWWWF